MTALSVTLRASADISAVYYLLSIAAGVVVMLIPMRLHAEKRCAAAATASWLFLMLSTAVFSRPQCSGSLLQLQPLYNFRLILTRGLYAGGKDIMQALFNIAMLSPVGFLMPLYVRKKRLVILYGFCFSLLIECMQLVLRRGCFDVDDLIHNTLGVFIAWCLVRAVQYHHLHTGKLVLRTAGAKV